MWIRTARQRAELLAADVSRGILACLESDAGALLARLVLFVAAVVVWFGPWRPDAGTRLLVGLHSCGRAAGACLLGYMFVPFSGVICSLGIWISFSALRLVDAVLFSWPRRLLRRVFDLGVAASFVVAILIEIGACRFAAVKWVAHTAKPPPLISMRLARGASRSGRLDLSRRPAVASGDLLRLRER